MKPRAASAVLGFVKFHAGGSLAALLMGVFAHQLWNSARARGEFAGPVVLPLDQPAGTPLDLERSSPRTLRAVPGVGEVRALALARERWRLRGSCQALDPDGLPGFGPKTVEALRAALQIPSGPLPPADAPLGAGAGAQP